jgi:nucleotide-binding universal stress UspA family protein
MALRPIIAMDPRRCQRGRPADALPKLAGDVDLVVFGSRRWGPVGRMLLGSTGEALRPVVTCPVLVVRPSA